jgi:hypothetical protein
MKATSTLREGAIGWLIGGILVSLALVLVIARPTKAIEFLSCLLRGHC